MAYLNLMNMKNSDESKTTAAHQTRVGVQLSFLVPDQCSSHDPVLPLSLAFQVVIGLLAEVSKYLHFLFK